MGLCGQEHGITSKSGCGHFGFPRVYICISGLISLFGTVVLPKKPLY